MTDMFDNRKIRYLRRLPEGNSIVLIWVMLLSLAGRCNAGGMIHLTRDIPYTPKMLADELDFEENTVLLALNALENLGMIAQDPLVITNWEEYQCTEKLEQIREQNRLRKQKQRALEAMSRDSHVTVTEDVTQCHATDKDIDIEEDIEEEKEKDISISERKKDKRKKADAEPTWSQSGSKLEPADDTMAVEQDPKDVISVFRSFLEREYRALSPEERKQAKEWSQKMMRTMEAYVQKHRENGDPLTETTAKSICSMLKSMFPREDWLGFFLVYIGGESA